MGDREILETYLNSATKNTSERDISSHRTISLLTSVIGYLLDMVAEDHPAAMSVEHIQH